MRILIGILAIAVCLFLMQAAARFGFSRLIARYALIANSVPAADEAVRLSPSDPDTHRARAIVFTRLQQPAEAVKVTRSERRVCAIATTTCGSSSETRVKKLAILQVRLLLWIRLCVGRRITHTRTGNAAIFCYAWEELLKPSAELRTAVAANRRYLPNMIDLAWGISREDVEATDKLLEIKDDTERLALIRYLARQREGQRGNGADATVVCTAFQRGQR